jgi:serine/threonine protein phosphatase PrpC
MSIHERLKTATEIANERVWTEAQLHPELLGMGATVTAVLAHGPMAYVAQVGDSRAYMIRGERIKQITKDQSFAQALLDSGAISLDQIHTVPQNVIMQAIGTQPTVKVVLTAVELHRNDYLIICSDGLSTKIKADEMRNAIHQSADLSTACRCMIDMANERGGEDNITVIAAQFDGVGLNSANDSSSITGSFKSISSDYLREKPAGQTQPLSSMPPPDPSVTTMVLPSLASIKEAPTDAVEAEAQLEAEPAADTVEATADDITPPTDTSEITLPLVNEEIPVASLMSESAKTETAARAHRVADIISWIIGVLVLSGAAYMIYTMLQEI